MFFIKDYLKIVKFCLKPLSSNGVSIVTKQLHDNGVCRSVPCFAGSAKKKVQKVNFRWESMNACRYKCRIQIQMEAILMKTHQTMRIMFNVVFY